MERQSSFGSQSSAGSAFTSRSATTKLVSEAEKENSVDGQQPGLLTALFGALYTLAKEKINDSANVAMLAIWVDFLMIFTLILMPEYPWKVDPNLWVFKVFYYIQIHLPIVNTGYMFYLVIFYILVAILFVSVAICIWVGWCFMNDSFPFLWPIKVARVVVSLFVSMFYIASLNIFLMACACDNEGGKWKHLFFQLDCLSFPHLIHAIVSLTSGVVFFVVAVLLVLGDHELEPMSRSLLAAPHSMCELRSLLCKTVITVADILFKPLPHVQTVLYCLSCGLIFYFHARFVPHYVPWINVLRGGLNAVLAWVSLMACILTFTVHWEWDYKNHPHWDRDDYRDMMTTLMAVGVPVSFIAGAAICWGHLVHAWRAALKFRVLPEGVKPRTIHRFWTEFDVEVASRVGRVWDAEGVLDQTALDLAENVLKAGVAMKPSSVFMHIAYSNFLIDVRHNIQSGWNHLDQATKLGPNLSYQFSIFTRKQEHKQQSGGAGGGEGGAVDLVSYVEFQKNYKSLMVYHKASLVATRDFWRLLTRDRVPLDRLGHSFKRMDEMESKAEATYKLVLDRYPSNAKLLRSYGKFLESIKNDPWGAARYYAEAEKQEELEESKAADIKVGDDSMVSDKSSAIITINATGIIQMANKVLTQMLGYKKGELNGKNVSMLMPPPFSTRHNSFLRNYTNTGKPKILDSTREVVALHKDRYVFPVSLKVTQIMGTGVDATFMGIMQPSVPEPGAIKAWLLPTGTVLCVDLSFMDYAGWGPQELVGRAFSSLGTDSSELDDLIAQSSSFSEEQLEAGALQITTSIKHKYAGSVPVKIKVTMGGTDAQRILVVCMKQLAETQPMGAFDHKGHCIYANSPLAAMLGYNLKVLKTKDITQLLPQPYGVMHLKHLKDGDAIPGKPTANSCRNSMTSVMLTSNNTPVYVKPTILPHTAAATVGGLGLLHDTAGSSGSTWAFTVERSSHTQLLDERRLSLGVSATGSILWSSAGTPEALFGLSARAILGQNLTNIIDVFADYLKDDASADVSTALAALVNCSAAKPGTSWRVGVGLVAAADQAKAQDQAAAAAAAAAAEKRILLRQATSKQKAKPAVMTVTLPGDDTLPEEAAEASADVALFIDLWRADVLLAVAEVVGNCSIVRAEPSMGLVFGSAHGQMLHSNLSKWLGLPAGTTLADLMGTKGQKKGGMKSSTMHKVGPLKQLSGLHSDGRPLTVSLQACLKDGNQESRLVLAVKPLKPLTGTPGTLEALVAASTADVDAGAHGEAAAAPAGVPGLALDKLSATAGTAAEGLLDTHRGTHRSNIPGSNLVTARLVDVDLPDGLGSPGRTPAKLLKSPVGSDDEGQHHGHGRHSPADSHQSREMDVSSGEEHEEHPKAAHAHHQQKHKKKHLTEDEMEAAMAAKGASKAREWLDSGFGGFKKDPARGALALPGAVEDLDAPPLFKGAGGGSDSAASGGGEGKGSAAAGEGAAAQGASEGGSESQATTNTAADGSLVSDYGRGKRLRKLIRLLSSKAAMQVVVGFRYKVILLVAVMFIVHMGAFGALVGFLGKQATYLDEMEAAGEVVDLVHRIASLSVVLEAAQRGYGLAAGDIATYAAEMEINYNRLDVLHQGLYLGFSGLRSLDSKELYALWHDDNLNATTYLDAQDPTKSALQRVSLFSLGGMYVSAAKEVQFAALNPGAAMEPGPLASSRSWLFIQANGPGTLYKPYLHSLDLMAERTIDNTKIVQKALLALLCIEGAGCLFLAVAMLIRLLRSISVHRQALFSVFLAVPNSYLRTLASKSVSIGDEDADEEDENDKIMQAAAEAKRKKKKQQEQADADNEHDTESAWGSMPGAITKALDKRKGKKAFFADDQAADGAVEVAIKVAPGAKGPSASSKGSFSLGPSGAGPTDVAADRQKLFNGKELVTSTKSAYQISWPILLWGALVLILYSVSYTALSAEHDTVVYIKMTQKARIAAGRLTYYAMRASLEPDPAAQAALQPLLAQESAHLTWVYNSAVYGTGFLSEDDPAAMGDYDPSAGALFAAPTHKQVLFGTHACLRHDTSTCLDKSSPFWAVSTNGLDGIVMRLAEESMLMSRYNTSALVPTSDGFQFVWQTCWYDLHDGISTIIHEFITENKAMFDQQRSIHVVLVLIMVFGGVAFLVMMLRPFLRHISKESRRCAELLVQLPPDFDVEGMVAATWSIVKQERLMVERSGRTFIDRGGLGNTLRALSYSIFGGQHPMAQHPRLSALAPDQQEEERLFSPRQGPTGAGGQQGPPLHPTMYRGGSMDMSKALSYAEQQAGKFAAGRGSGRFQAGGVPNRGGGGPPMQGSPRAAAPHSRYPQAGGEDDDEEGGRGGGMGGVGGHLRHRPAGGRGGGGGVSGMHSRRAIVPVDDDML